MKWIKWELGIAAAMLVGLIVSSALGYTEWRELLYPVAFVALAEAARDQVILTRRAKARRNP